MESDAATEAATGVVTVVEREQRNCPIAHHQLKMVTVGSKLGRQPMDNPVIALDLDEGCDRLVQLMRSSKGILCYTGAGVSTSANLPDYRGPNGVIRTAMMGRAIKLNNPATCDPTQTHLCIREFCYHKIFKHVLSQNCDGLHLRSGIPQKILSEIHGNMHIEVCLSCQYLQYFRPTDVNPNSSVDNHETGRQCSNCRGNLFDTIVQRGEEGFLPFPNNWPGVFNKISECDLVICAGTSFEILRCYKRLFPPHLKIVIVNVAPTKKDKDAVLIIREESDKVFVKLAEAFGLDIRHYCRSCDPVLNFRTSRREYFMTNYTFCKCHVRAPRVNTSRTASISNGIPGFMMGGLPVSVQRVFRKNVSLSDILYLPLVAQNTDDVPEQVEVEKRKRGRPRKQSNEAEPEVKVKRRVGRPRKTPVNSAGQESEAGSTLGEFSETVSINNERNEVIPAEGENDLELALCMDDVAQCVEDLVLQISSNYK
uniref:Regulatory protein SIR2 homolog 7 n=1 Tax=Steinernema glaseri TaxID=37863 RepID=A0A1I7Z3H5_9BILA